jgi:arabinofuranosyltransferase
MSRKPALPRKDRGPRRPDHPRRSRLFELGVVLALVIGIASAVRLAWACDDAFISFRYADNLVHGLGLVFNAGERVEGYSNFLWTLGIALGMRLGVDPEPWTMAWGVFFYAATIALLCALPRVTAKAQGRTALGLPLAGLLAAVHRDWNIYATSGLETSCFTFLVTLAYALAVVPTAPAWTAGIALALAALTRPDGILFVPFFVLYVALARPRRVRSSLELMGAFLALWLPYVAWKIRYYGDFFPNTYYAKSAMLAWWSQGWIYVRLYFQKYWSLALAIPLWLAATIIRRRVGNAPDARTAPRKPDAPAGRLAAAAWTKSAGAFAAVLAVTFTLYVMRVGGDFMFARMLIPATPFYLLVLEAGCARLFGGRRLVEIAVTAGLVLAVALMPYPFAGNGWAGIANEREFYKPEDVELKRAEGATLRRYFADLPVRIAIVGSQARLAYYARPAVVVEAQTGLTDPWIARQPLLRRARVGHEKVAPVPYLLSRGVDFVFHHFAAVTLNLHQTVPTVVIYFDGVQGYMVHWDPQLLGELAKRGALFVDFPSALDARRAAFERLPSDSLRMEYARLKAFYFDSVPDSVRQARFLR